MTQTPALAPRSGNGAGSRTGRPVPVIAADVLAVVVFVLVGRGSHGEDEGVRGVLVTLWPFLTGLLAGWLLLLVLHARPLAYRTGVALVAATVAIGMLLRHTVSHDGTPPSFVIAASVFLALFLVGWRAVVTLVGRRRG